MAWLLLLALSTAPVAAAPQLLLSAHNPLAPRPPDYQYSTAPVISADGRFVLFVSTANDLVPGDNSQLGADLFLRDRSSNTTILVSANLSGNGGGNGSSGGATLSADARFVLFESTSSDLVPGDTNGVSDLFLRDLLTSTTALVSADTNGGCGNGASSDAVMTPDGRFIAFLSFASNLVAGDTNGIADVFVRDTLAGATSLSSVGATGPLALGRPAMASPSITPDGRFIAFVSFASNLVGGMTQFPGDIFVRDVFAATTTWVSSNLSAIQAPTNSPSTHPVMSDDGRFIAFKYGPTNGTAPVTVFRYDAMTGVNLIVNTNSFPTWPYFDDVYGPEMTPDGRFVVTTTRTTISTTNYSSVHIWDAQTTIDTLVSQDRFGGFPSNRLADTPAVTPDGRYVAFISTATNLVTNSVTNGLHLFLRDVQLGTTQLIDVDTNGAGSTDITGAVASLSADGRYVAFSSPDAGFTAGDTNRAFDVFVRDTTNAVTELISARNPAVSSLSGAGFSSATQLSITPDGRWVVFTSRADDLVLNDFNNEQDIFVTDLLSGTTTLASVATNGNSPLGGFSDSPVISSDGRYVAFVSIATNLIAGVANPANKIFRRDLLNGTNSLVNVDSTGVSLGNADSLSPAMSQNGRYVAFLSKSNNPAGSAGVFWRDLDAGQTFLVAAVASTNILPSMSADGRYVAYGNSASQLFVWDSLSASNIYTNVLNAGGAAISPSGAKLLFSVPQNILHRTFVSDVATGSNVFDFLRTQPVRSPAQWSANERYFAFVAGSNSVPGDTNLTNDVFLCDLQTGSLTLVSLNYGHTGSANGPSDSPAMSGDGRFVVFRSFAADIVPGLASTPNLFVFDRLTGSNTLFTMDPQPAFGWSRWVSKPAVSSSGLTVAFQSYRSGLVPFDLNRVQDVFVSALTPWDATDSDADGIPDAWLTLYFGHPTGQAGDLSRAQDDQDGDGLTNLQEYLAGTNPVDPASVLRLQISAVVSSNSVTLTWPAVPGKSFKVQFMAFPSNPTWFELGGNAAVVGNQGSFTTSLVPPLRYYRVVAVN